MRIVDVIGPDKRVETIKLLKTITGNIINAPHDGKYRRINENSQAFKQLMTTSLIGKLVETGFKSEDGHLIWPYKTVKEDSATLSEWNRLKTLHDSLNDASSSRISRQELARITEERLNKPQISLRTPPAKHPETRKPIKLSRPSRIMTLEDIDDKRKVPTHYAEDYLSTKPLSRSFLQIVTSRQDAEYIGRLAVDLTNKYRVEQKKLPLQWDQSIYEVSSLHAQGMASGAEPFSHNNFDRRVDLIRLKTGLVYSAAENIAMNSGTERVAEVAVEGWIASPGHQANLVGQFTRCAVGVACYRGQYFFSQMLIA